MKRANRDRHIHGDSLSRALRRFRLTATLTPGGSAAAVFLLWNGVGLDVTTTTLTVHDPLSQFSGGASMDGWAIWSPAASRWEVFAIGASVVLGKTDASHAKAASGTVSVWTGSQGSEVDSTVNITAFNRFADVASGKWVMCAWNGYGWYLISAEC